MTYQCENTFHLQEFMFEQDVLEEKYLQSLPERQEEIISYSVEILEGLCDEDVYHQVFGEYWEEERSEYNSFILCTVEEWLDGETEDWENEDWDVMEALARKALVVSAETLFGESLYSMAEDGFWDINSMCAEVLGL